MSDTTGREPLVVVGPPGSGKSTVGRLLARRLGVDFHDADAEIERRQERSIGDIFAVEGEAVFRRIEEEAVERGLAEYTGVYALGGGAVLSENIRERLTAHIVVFLDVGLAEGVRRTGLSAARPLLAGVNPRATYKSLLEARKPIYSAVATVRVDTDRRTPEEVVADVQRQLAAQTSDAGL